MDIKAIIEEHLPEDAKLGEKVINSIVKGIKAEQGKEFIPKDEYGKKTLKVDELEKQVRELAGKAADADAYKKKMDELKEAHKKELEEKQKEFDTYRTDTESKESREKKQKALHEKLKADGANEKLVGLLASQFDLEEIELDGEEIKDWDNISRKVKEEYKDVFGTVVTKGVDPAKPPAGNQSNITMEDIRQMSSEEINKNWKKIQEVMKG